MAFISSSDKSRLGRLTVARAADPFYNDCGVTKTCFGSPDGCVSGQDCVAVMAVRVEGTRYLFEMKARNAAYVAVGISDDQKMVSARPDPTPIIGTNVSGKPMILVLLIRTCQKRKTEKILLF